MRGIEFVIQISSSRQTLLYYSYEVGLTSSFVFEDIEVSIFHREDLNNNIAAFKFIPLFFKVHPQGTFVILKQFDYVYFVTVIDFLVDW